MPVRSVLIADDHLLVRDTLVHYLQAGGDLRVDAAGSFAEALDRARTQGPYDVVLLDVVMPGMSGLESIQHMVAANDGGAVVLISGQLPHGLIDAAVRAGARGFVPKHLPASTLRHALRQVIAGRVYLPPEMHADLPRALPPALAHLTPQEARVLRHLCEGRSNKEIARAMDLTEVTIKTHMRAVCTKLEARNRTHAALIGSTHFKA
ncbi:MAG: response regulator [Gemmobacter sp.]|uniref:response regulator n=1 Tax=Gemmobacter sp. TaxID=1898957 RepID=UPI00391B7967